MRPWLSFAVLALSCLLGLPLVLTIQFSLTGQRSVIGYLNPSNPLEALAWFVFSLVFAAGATLTAVLRHHRLLRFGRIASSLPTIIIGVSYSPLFMAILNMWVSEINAEHLWHVLPTFIAEYWTWEWVTAYTIAAMTMAMIAIAFGRSGVELAAKLAENSSTNGPPPSYTPRFGNFMLRLP